MDGARLSLQIQGSLPTFEVHAECSRPSLEIDGTRFLCIVG